MKNKKCVVTGGAGFIGSHLCEKLLLEGAKVVIIDDLSTGLTSNIELLKNQGAEFVHGSILDVNLLEEILVSTDYVFHLAAIPSVVESLENPLKTAQVNTFGTINLLEKSRKHRIKKFIFSSSCAIYGNNSNLPLKEKEIPKPLSPYATQKLSSEYFCKIYNSIFGLKTTILRYFNVYGPRQRADSDYAAVIPVFIDSLINRVPLNIYGDGHQTRDFIFVKDIVEANIESALCSSTDGKIMNIAQGQRTTILDIAGLIIEAFSTDTKPIFLKPRAGEILHSEADISLSKNLLNFRCDYDIRTGITETVRHMVQFERE